MAYSRTTWKDRKVEKPRTYKMQNNADGTITLIPMEGTVVEPGTPINALNMNNIEEGIDSKAEKSIYGDDGTFGLNQLNAKGWSIYRDDMYKCVILRNMVTKMSLAIYDDGTISYNGKPLALITPTSGTSSSLLDTADWKLYRSNSDGSITLYNKRLNKSFVLYDDGRVTYHEKRIPVVQLPSFEQAVKVPANTKVTVTHNLGYKPITEIGTTLGNVSVTWAHIDNNTIQLYNYQSGSSNEATAYIRCW